MLLVCRDAIPARHHLLLHPMLLLRLHLLLHPQLPQIPEPHMRQRVIRTDPHLRSQLQHLPQQVQAHLIDLLQDEPQVLRGVDVEVGLVFWELRDAGPGALGRCAHQAEDLLQLVFVGGAGEEGPAGVHLCHDAAGRPYVYAGIVGSAPQQHVGGSIPQRDDLV